MRWNRILITAIALLTIVGSVEAEKKYITITPAKEYRAGGLHNFFFGAHWRNLWTTPVKVEVLDLGTFDGGLTAYKRGGGMQTKSLRLKAPSGKIWKFRSMNKDPQSVLPKELRQTVVRSVIQDQISASNPMGALVLPPILNAVGILQAVPTLMYMPDDERLGKFRKEFGGMLGTIEIHPKGRDKDLNIEGFEGAKKIINTVTLFKRLEKERDEWVDAADFLKARLVDIFVGDWDRHSDQWLWAKYKEGNKKLWNPIPRDRDQAFSKLDGLLPWLSRYLIIHLSSFGKKHTSAKKITWSGRFVDRRFLSGLDKETWDRVTAFVKEKLTNEVIEEAVKGLPPEHYKIAAKELITKLKYRRDHLTKVSKNYYKRINKVIDVYTSNKNDFVEVDRVDDNTTEIRVYKRAKKKSKKTGTKKGAKKGKPYWYKKVENRLTSEIRIYLEDGDDRAEVKGVVKRSPLVRIIGADGKDEMVDTSHVKGYFLHITPIPKAEKKTIFYDSGKKSIFQRGPGTKVITRKHPKPKSDYEKYESRQRNRGSDLYMIPMIGFNTDDGFVLGGSMLLNKFNFRVNPYEYSLFLNATYASKTNSSHINFKGTFNSIIHGVSIRMQLLKTQLLFNDYYGFGNDTSYNKEMEEAELFDTEENFYVAKSSFHFKLFKKAEASLGINFTASDMELDHESLLANFPHGQYGLGKFNSLKLTSSITLNSRDNAANPYKGFYLHLHGAYTPKWFDNDYSYFNAGIDARAYLGFKLLTPMTLALRMGGAKNFGDYPFFDAVYLGGGGDLRGYNRKRFSGDAALFGQMELRVHLFPVKLVLPGYLGFHVFSDAGRVFTDNMSSDTIHTSYGGGIWIAFAKRMVNMSFTYAKSDERTSFYFALKLMY